MPYRVAHPNQPCAVCEKTTAGVCRRCRAPLCDEHAALFQFYVPTRQCLDAAMCKPFTAADVDTRRDPPEITIFGVKTTGIR